MRERASQNGDKNGPGNETGKDKKYPIDFRTVVGTDCLQNQKSQKHHLHHQPENESFGGDERIKKSAVQKQWHGQAKAESGVNDGETEFFKILHDLDK